MLTDILEIDQPTLASMFDFAIKTGGNLIVFGAAGTGKTEMAIQATKNNNIKYIYVNLSVLEAVDLVGLPGIKDGSTIYNTPEFLPLAENDDEPIVLILDEIDKAKEELQNPCLELFQFRSVNGKKLNIKAILATGNLPDERAFSRKISHALTNRCLVFKVKHDFNAWRRWALSNNINSLVLGFLERNQDLLLDKPHKDDPTAYCSPSPRAWTFAAKDLDELSFEDFMKMNLDSDLSEAELQNAFVNLQFKIVSGRVGFGAAFRFKTWLKYYKELEPMVDSLLKSGDRPTNLSSDSIMIFTIAALSKLRLELSAINKKDKVSCADKVFSWMCDEVPPEFCLSAMKCTINNEFIKANGLMDSEPLNTIFDEISELIF